MSGCPDLESGVQSYVEVSEQQAGHLAPKTSSPVIDGDC